MNGFFVDLKGLETYFGYFRQINEYGVNVHFSLVFKG